MVKNRTANYHSPEVRVCVVRMKRERFEVARCTVAGLMKQIGIRGAVRGKFVKTTFQTRRHLFRVTI